VWLTWASSPDDPIRSRVTTLDRRATILGGVPLRRPLHFGCRALAVALAVLVYPPVSSAAAPATTNNATTTTSNPPTSTTPPTSATTAAPPAPPPVDLAAIRSAQAAAVTQRHQSSIAFAALAVSGSELAAGRDQSTAAQAQAQAAAAQAIAVAAGARLGSDRASLLQATTVDRAARTRLAEDRARLRGLALGVYTGALTGPQPATVQSLTTDQQAAIDGGEVDVVAQVVVTNLAADTRAAAIADRRYRVVQLTVSSDQVTLTTDRARAAVSAGQVPIAVAAAARAQRQLTAAEGVLATGRAELRADLAAVAGPPSLGRSALSVMGRSALDANQLTVWFNDQGYSDLTPAAVRQLAGWYLGAGAAEGVRGDVAFAQAVLETGGFSSPDAVALNNYAGIGHCDTCATGWPFPTPYGGVVGQLQLLRIFAGAGTAPKPAPTPVLPALTPARQDRHGCCPTWESLTGVWATDPAYAAQILLLYQQILTSATAAQPAGTGT
jgi:hypothetical protein